MIKYIISSFCTRLFVDQQPYSTLHRFHDALHEHLNYAAPVELAEAAACVEGTVLCKNGKPISIEKPKQ